MLLGEDLGRRHERDLEAVLHRDERRNQGDDRLAGADVSLQQAVHRRRALQVLDDVLERVTLAGGELEWQHRPRRRADAIVDGDRERLFFRRRGASPRQQAHLEQECLLEDQPALGRRVEAVELLHRQVRGREMRTE